MLERKKRQIHVFSESKRDSKYVSNHLMIDVVLKFDL